ncbi:hypothetical protein EVAR_36682_1 [Eumeta japonica]|uniref:Uncharacterized protein n=1 Tax=Eumeta variegata TaxID=151549 RepID=A0A4C1ZC33_EUMVA|nr:hypothetical protein EVAR_36682_1 [Eumeta japonica]
MVEYGLNVELRSSAAGGAGRGRWRAGGAGPGVNESRRGCIRLSVVLLPTLNFVIVPSSNILSLTLDDGSGSAVARKGRHCLSTLRDKQAWEPPKSKWSQSPMDIRNSRRVVTALSASWISKIVREFLDNSTAFRTSTGSYGASQVQLTLSKEEDTTRVHTVPTINYASVPADPSLTVTSTSNASACENTSAIKNSDSKRGSHALCVTRWMQPRIEHSTDLYRPSYLGPMCNTAHLTIQSTTSRLNLKALLTNRDVQ